MSDSASIGQDDCRPGRVAPIYVREWAHKAPRRVVVLAHGYGEHVGRYEHVAARLVDDGAHVVAVDHLGHGRSEGERVLIEDFGAVVDDLHDVAAEVAAAHPGLPVVLLGHSMGGTIAARYAQRFGAELAGLVLSGPVLAAWPGARGMLELPAIPDEPLDPGALSRDPAVGEAYAADPLVWHGPFKRPTLEAWVREQETMDAAAPLGALPVLWVHGEDDPLVPLDSAREGIARLGADDLVEDVRPGARHEVLNETDREEVLDLVSGFVERVAP